MKILITGMTSRNSGRKIDYANHAPIFRDLFTDLGHAVELRPLTLGDVKSGARGYDLVLAFHTPPLDFHCGDSLLVTALTGARSSGLWVGFDDWQFHRIWSGYGTISRLPKYKYDSVAARGRRHRDDFVGSARLNAAFDNGCEHWLRDRFRLPLLLTVFPWHQASEYKHIARVDKPLFVDPSSYVALPGIERPPRRARRHVLAVLGDHSRWVEKQRPRWPVERYGYKAERLPEPELVQRYARAWTVLAPKYPHPTAAWWRARFNFAAHAHSILITDQSDITRSKLPAYDVTVSEVEGMRPTELRDLSLTQASQFNRHTWGKQQLQSVMETMLNEIE